MSLIILVRIIRILLANLEGHTKVSEEVAGTSCLTIFFMSGHVVSTKLIAKFEIEHVPLCATAELEAHINNLVILRDSISFDLAGRVFGIQWVLELSCQVEGEVGTEERHQSDTICDLHTVLKQHGKFNVAKAGNVFALLCTTCGIVSTTLKEERNILTYTETGNKSKVDTSLRSTRHVVRITSSIIIT